MTVLHAQNITCQFPNGHTLFSNLTCSLKARRVGLVGRNGIGKSVLARILIKELTPTAGSVSLNGRAQYYSQIPEQQLMETTTIAQLLKIEDLLSALAQVEKGCCEPELFDRIGERWHVRAALSSELMQLGLSDDPHQPCHLLSGGQLSRIRLWALFQSEADLLILDEPSNHLDKPTREWLIQQMSIFKGHILLLSHDRLLLQEMEHIWALTGLGLREYGMGFDQYRTEQEQERLAITEQLQQLQREQKQLEVQVQRSREKAEQRSRQGQSIRKSGSQPKILLNGMRSRATASASHRARNEKGRRESLARAASNLQARYEGIRAEVFHTADQGSCKPYKKLLAKVSRVILPYGSRQAISLMIKGDSRVHVQGRNGSGKSTFFHMLASRVQPVSGESCVNVPVFYLDQHFALLNNDQSMLSNMLNFCPGLQLSCARTALAGIGFRQSMVQRSVRDLSGGEKMKLAMLIVMQQPNYPLLLLDEPDNHLDIDAKLLLSAVLKVFKGALMLISHDDAFVSDCQMTEVLSID